MRIIVSWSFVFIVGLFGIQIGCAQDKSLKEFRNGDLLFVGAQKENLSGAINRVTQIHDSIAFDHVGIVEIIRDSVFVLHASSKKGSTRELYTDFYDSEKKENNSIYLYRLKKQYSNSIEQAITNANKMLGKPYNWTYILNDTSYYCSDYVQRAFADGEIFSLEPMTFVNPQTGKIDDFWLEFYRKQNLVVPEGKLGCNPNGLADSDKLEFVTSF